MSLLRDAKTLKDKAIASLKIAMATFNSYDDEGRICSALLHLQHASEMLLKAVLVQNKVDVFDKKSRTSIGFDKCVRLCQSRHGLSAQQAGVMRAIDALRGSAQHWFIYVSEDLFYMQTRALITAFDAYLKSALNLDLQTYIPLRVLPVSTLPPGDFEFLVDKEYKLIHDLLKPGRRQRDEARARIRSLLAMEALIAEEVEISEKDVDRIEKALKAGEEIGRVFPRLVAISTIQAGEGPTLKIQFSKKEGIPVRYIAGDDPSAVAAIREVDMQKKFHMRASEIARKLELTEPKCKALRHHLAIDADEGCCHVFEFGKSTFPCYSDNALKKMQDFIKEGGDIKQIWQDYKAQPK
jgi:hypothetical protein